MGQVKKVHVLAGVAVTAAILAYAYYRSARGDEEPTAATEPTTDPYAQAGSDSWTPTSGGSSGSSGDVWPYGYDVNGNPLPAPVPGGGTTGGATGVTGTNADWLTQAVAMLQGAGVTEAAATSALSGVLGGVGVTSDQEGMFLRAVGILGNPPQGYPRPIRLISTPADPAPAPQPPPAQHTPEPAPWTPPPQQWTPEPAPAPWTPPPPAPVAPKPTAGKQAPARVSGLKATSKGETWVQLDWNPVSGADGYTVYRNGARIITVTYSAYKATGLKENTSYTFEIKARDNGLEGPGASLSVKTNSAPKLVQKVTTSKKG